MSTFLLSLLLQLAVPAQQTTTPNPADLCTIQGVVMKAGTGEPLHKAMVDAWPTANRRGGNDQSQGGSAETDAMGRFEIKGLNPGRYYLSASRNGFVRQQYGQRTPEGQGAVLTLSSGESLPITFQMIPAAVISGHVYDEDGEPVVYAQVTTMRYSYVNGQRQLLSSGQAQTNDLGEFRIFGLSPGQYFVQATLRNSRTTNAKSRQAYIPIYYPGVPDPVQAAPIVVRGGDEFSGVDISLQPTQSVAVRGNIISAGCEGALPGGIVFLSGQNYITNVSTPATIRDANGQKTFDFPSVSPGSYYLSASIMGDRRECVGHQVILVADTDLDGVTVTVTPGVQVKGQVRCEGQNNADLSTFSVDLSPRIESGAYRYSFMDAAKPDGSFVLKSVYGGDYEILVGGLPDNYFLKSARLDGIDVLTAGVTIDSRQTPGTLEVVVSPNGASVDGTITKDQQPFQGATVAIVPDPPHRGERRLFKSTPTDQNGHFILQGLPPGDYKVFAWEKIESGAYTSAEFLQQYENLGESIHVTEGSRNSAQVDLIPAKDSNP